MCALLLMMLLVARTVADGESPLRCRDPRCRHIGSSRPQEHQFDVDGNELWLKYRESDGYLRIKCNETSILESPAMPRADPALSVWELVVERCQLPAGSLAGKLAELNVTMLFTERNVTLTIERLPPATVLSAKHFSSLERLVSLNISADAAAPIRAESGFLSQLQNLRSITLQYVTLSADELDAPRPLLQSLTLNHTDIERLPEAVYSSSSLLYLTIESGSALDAVEMPPKLCSLKLRSSETTLRIDAVPSLEELDVTSWSELQPPPLTRCDRLRKLYLTAPAVRTLPKDWLINCMKLQEVVFQNARNLNTLPHGLFWRYNYVVKLVAFKEGALETLAENQFEGLHALATLELNGNRLRMISRLNLF